MALLALSFVALIVIRIPLAHFLAGPLGYGADGIWMAMLVSSALAVVLNLLYYRWGKWQKMQLLNIPGRPAPR